MSSTAPPASARAMPSPTDGAQEPLPGRWREVMRSVVPPVVFAAVVVAIWQVSIPVLGISSFVAATPSRMVSALASEPSLYLDNAWVTAQEILLGFAASAVVGVLIAMLLARFDLADRAVSPIVVLFQTMPKVALAPIFVLWFGYAMAPKLLLILAIAFFPVALNMRAGLAAVDPDLVLLMRSVGATRNQILFRAQLPTSIPYLFAGLRIAVTFSVIGAVVAEFSAASQGLGYLISYESTQLATDKVFAGLLVISLLGLVFYYLLSAIERIVWIYFPRTEARVTGA